MGTKGSVMLWESFNMRNKLWVRLRCHKDTWQWSIPVLITLVPMSPSNLLTFLSPWTTLFFILLPQNASRLLWISRNNRIFRTPSPNIYLIANQSIRLVSEHYESVVDGTVGNLWYWDTSRLMSSFSLPRPFQSFAGQLDAPSLWVSQN